MKDGGVTESWSGAEGWQVVQTEDLGSELRFARGRGLEPVARLRAEGCGRKPAPPKRAVPATGGQAGGSGGPWRSRKDDEALLLTPGVLAPPSIR